VFPKLVHARKAKLMMGRSTGPDAHGLNQLQRNGHAARRMDSAARASRPTRLPRTRMVLVHQCTRLNNRIHATSAKYTLNELEVSDLLGARGRAILRERLKLLPPHTTCATEQLLKEIERSRRRIRGGPATTSDHLYGAAPSRRVALCLQDRRSPGGPLSQYPLTKCPAQK
jgi:hypothetical protein